MRKQNRSFLIAWLMAACFVGLAMSAAWAADKGPQKVTKVLPGGDGTITPPTGDTGRFTAEYLVFAAATGETMTVSYTVSGVTQTYGTKVTATGDFVLALTNMPPLFAGDTVTVATDATGVTNSVTLIGTLYD